MRLVECLDCQTENTLNSRFCRSCGGRLPEDEVLELRAENAKLILDAKVLFNDHRFDECKMLAESVLEIDPSDLDAKALLADCFEKEGRIEDAIELYEEIAAGRPDSAIDRVRLHHLRRLIAVETEIPANPNTRRNALFSAIATFVLISCVGAAFILAGQNKTKTIAETDLLATNQGNAEAFRTVIPVPTSVPPTNIPEGSIEPLNQPSATDPNAPVINQNSNAISPTRGVSRRLGGSMTSTASNSSEPGLQPLVPEVPPNFSATVTPNQNQQNNKPKNNDPDPSTTIDPNKNGNAKAPPENNGIVEIQVLNGKSSGASADDNAKSAEALIRKARDLYAQGSYSAAVKTYEDALAVGASSGSTNQRIGQCYEKLGNRSAAIAAYKRAAASYQSSINRGSGGSRVEAALDACNQAIKNLGG